MATAITTSPWTLLASHQIWSYSDRCTMHFQVFAYCTQDPINNRSTVYTRSRIAIVNNNPSYSGYKVNQTWKVGMTGAADYSWSGTIADAGAGVTSERILSNGSFTVNHDGNGNASSAVYYWFNGSYTGAIASPAAPNGVAITLPKIDRTAGTPTISNVSSTYNSASCNITVPYASTINQYSRDGSNWTDWNRSVSANSAFSHTWSGLSPNTTYTFYYRFRRDYNKIWSSAVSFSVTTKKPAAPTKGTVSVSSTTYNSITYSWSKFRFGAGATWGEYQISFNGGAWTSVGTNTSYTASNLSPNTSYTLNVRLKDNYNQYSGKSSVTGTTIKTSAPTAGTISVSNITPFGATFSWNGFNFGAGATWGKYQYSWHDTEWYDCGQSTSITLSDRKPNTSNTFYVRLIDNYGKASPSATVVVTTLKPTAPTAGTILVKNITYRGATLFWDGFSFGNGADFGKYQYNYNGSWLDCGADTTVTLKNLSSNASYTFQVRLIDNYGTASNSVSITFQTKSEESWRYVNQYIKVNGTWKSGIVYYKVDGIWRTVTGTYFKGQTPTVTLVDSNGSILTDSNGIVLNAIQ